MQWDSPESQFQGHFVRIWSVLPWSVMELWFYSFCMCTLIKLVILRSVVLTRFIVGNTWIGINLSLVMCVSLGVLLSLLLVTRVVSNLVIPNSSPRKQLWRVNSTRKMLKCWSFKNKIFNCSWKRLKKKGHVCSVEYWNWIKPFFPHNNNSMWKHFQP